MGGSESDRNQEAGMTKQRDLKRHVRERMDKTGERYAAARANALGKVPKEGKTETETAPPDRGDPFGKGWLRSRENLALEELIAGGMGVQEAALKVAADEGNDIRFVLNGIYSLAVFKQGDAAGFLLSDLNVNGKSADALAALGEAILASRDAPERAIEWLKKTRMSPLEMACLMGGDSKTRSLTLAETLGVERAAILALRDGGVEGVILAGFGGGFGLARMERLTLRGQGRAIPMPRILMGGIVELLEVTAKPGPWAIIAKDVAHIDGCALETMPNFIGGDGAPCGMVIIEGLKRPFSLPSLLEADHLIIADCPGWDGKIPFGARVKSIAVRDARSTLGWLYEAKHYDLFKPMREWRAREARERDLEGLVKECLAAARMQSVPDAKGYWNHRMVQAGQIALIALETSGDPSAIPALIREAGIDPVELVMAVHGKAGGEGTASGELLMRALRLPNEDVVGYRLRGASWINERFPVMERSLDRTPIAANG
jgi:hypothetical protein